MTLQRLPDAQADRLRALHASGDRQALKAYIAALRAQQWPLRAIGEPLGLPRSTIHYFENTNYGPQDTSVIPLSPRAIETAGSKTVRWRSHIPASYKDELQDLASQARKVRAQTPEHSKLRSASARLDRLIAVFLDRMVPVTEIAAAMGVTHRAVMARMERRNSDE